MNSIPPHKNRRVLVIDDNRAIHDDFRKILSPASATAADLDAKENTLFGRSTGALVQTQFEIDSAFQGQEGLLLVKSALEAGRPYAMAFVDVRMPPGWDGVETTRKLWELDPDLQVVLCTAYADYSWGEMSERLGHRDGLLILKKPFDAVEAFQLAHALTEKWWLHQQSRRKMEDLETVVGERTSELRESQALYHSLVEQLPAGIFRKDAAGRFVFVNPWFCQLKRMPADQILGRTALEITTRESQNLKTMWRPDLAIQGNLHHEQIMQTGQPIELEETYASPDGQPQHLQIVKSAVFGPDKKIIGSQGVLFDITGRKRVEESLRESNEKFHQLADNITDAFWIRSQDMREVHYVSPAFERIWGRPVESLYANPQQWADFILPEDRERVLAAFAALTGDTPSLDIEYRIVRPNGDVRWVRVRGFQVRDAAKELIRHIGIVTDITERKRLETQLFQSQKMETVGKLAGGIAHEFNSILTAIIGQSELILGDLPSGHPLSQNAAGIRKAAERAATLTRQLLAYGRKTFLRPESLDLNHVIAAMEGTLRHLMGEDVDVRIVPAGGLHTVKADAGQIEQVIMNMAMNARHAMPNGGKLTLETANVSFDLESVGRYPELKPGDYVMLAITDTGTGMSEEVKARVFEPFFTTKGVGQGTGLGLSTCYGIIKQSGGHISVYSEVARGCSFKIYLPQVEAQVKLPAQRIDSPDLPRGTETILLAEDDPALREMAATLLRRLGYTVLTAANGIEALSLNHQRNSGHIDLLFTDVVMPHMSGKELADRVRAANPHTRVLFTSAYTENAIIHQGVLNKGVALLQKPFTPSALAHRLREVLDPPAAAKPDSTQKTFGFTKSSDEAKSPGN